MTRSDQVKLAVSGKSKLTSGVAFGEELNCGTTNNQDTVTKGDLRRVQAVDRVVLELVRGVLGCQERIIDGNDSGCEQMNDNGRSEIQSLCHVLVSGGQTHRAFA